MNDLDELEKLAKAATSGVWELANPRPDGRNAVRVNYDPLFPDDPIKGTWIIFDTDPADAEFIAAANPKVILELIERVRQAEAERDAALAVLERVRALHRNAGPSQGYDSRFKGGYGMLGDCCAACGSHGEYGVEWPCPTIQALDGAPEPEEKP